MNPMPDPPSTADDPRLIAAVQEYLAEMEAGRRPDRSAFAARFPDLAEAMAPYLDALELVHGAAPLVQSGGRATPPALTAEPLGDFHIVREIGRGGMGVVYEAVQRSLGRRVALKVLPFAAALDARQLQRFRNEAQAAAHLHHQNIVPVYAVGAERGVHFYAMQLIEGQNLAALISTLAPGEPRGVGRRVKSPSTEPFTRGLTPPGAPAAETRPALTIQLTTQHSQRAQEFFRTVAKLAAQAAEALDYAHGLGIIHRDIKPANLLVDDRGNLWITDFGLAQFQANTGLTQTGDLVGTLRYMSPEQAGGQRILIDHRTDVYSLGATLYEMLTLRPIFDAEDRQALLHQIMHAEPRPPRAVARAIPAELETIVLKAASKAPADRYATARDFADDLHRFLRHEPILARRPTLAQRGRKWLRRHPSVAGAAVVLLVLLSAGSLVSAWLIRGEQEKARLAYEREHAAALRLGDEQEKTRRAYESEQRRAEEAEARFRLAQKAVDEMIQLSAEELVDNPQMQGLRKRLLESALVYYQEFIDRRQREPGAQLEELRETKAKVEQMLADHAALHGAGQRVLLEQPAVLADLALSDDERARILALAARQRKEGLELFDQSGRLRLTPAERGARFLEQARAHDAAVHAVLTPAQVRRLEQIALQLKGAAAFRELDVAAALKLTPEQRRRIREIDVGPAFGPPDGMPKAKWGKGTEKKFPGQPPEDFKKPFEPFPRDGPPRDRRHREALERALELLTDDQLRTWREMSGAPFTAPLPFPPPLVPGGGFGPPPHGPPRPIN